MGKRVEKKKKKKRDFSFPGLGTRFLAHPGRERARGSAYGPAAAHERGGDGAVREGDGGEGTAVKGRRGVVCGEDDEAADRWGRSCQWERARERGRLAGGAGLSVRERRGAERAGARAEAGRRWAERGGGARARGGGEAAGLGRESAQQGEGRVFLFFFLLSNSYFPFCIFFF
jgi:hypothetical protein